MRKKIDPILESIYQKDLAALVKAIEQGVGLEQPDQGGRTPLSNAVIGGQSEVVKMLLRAGASFATSDKQGYTPLHHAAQRHSVDLAHLLLDAGADVDAKDIFGNTPLFRAVFECRGRGEVIELLLNAGANQNSENNSGVSPRKLASSIANFNVLPYLQEP
jgi:ankyrin repeat protein